MLDVARGPRECALLPGELLADKYRIERVLGQGGMGVVLGARNVLLGKRVAVKLVARGAGDLSVPRLLMEARAAARLESDHAVRIFDVGHTEQGDPYLIMEHLEGRSLSELLAGGAPLPAAQAVLWVLEACDALAEAHAHGIVHRDVKPANLFLEQRPDGSTRVKVLDFGIAKLPPGERLTTTTHPIGSPVYMAPEQLANAPDVDLRADVWGVGCVLYELLAGRAPFEANSVVELATKIAGGAHAPLHALRPELPEALSRVVARCLEADRTRRYADLSELGRALLPFAPPGAAQLLERSERWRAAADATRDLPSAPLPFAATHRARAAPESGADALRESAPALTNSLSHALSVKSTRAGSARHVLLAGAAAACVSALGVLSLQRAPSPAAPPALPHVAARAVSAAPPEPQSIPSAEPEPSGAPEPATLARPAPSEAPAPAASHAPEPSARRASARPARPKTNRGAHTAGSGADSKARSSTPPLVSGPLPLDREAPW